MILKKDSKKEGKYSRIYEQLEQLLTKTDFLFAKLATINAVLHHKNPQFFWTGFYLLIDDELVVGPYQGSLACQVLKRNTGVCWASINLEKTIVVEDVHQFPGHIACDSRSNSEIAVPLRNNQNEIIGCLDIDSEQFACFDEIDALWLEKIAALVRL